MSGGPSCKCGGLNRTMWYVQQRHCNYSAFAGYRRTYSAYSRVTCLSCETSWRTKAAYVDRLPDFTNFSGPLPDHTKGHSK